AMPWRSVDLPDPFGPMIAVSVPPRSSKSARSNATTAPCANITPRPTTVEPPSEIGGAGCFDWSPSRARLRGVDTRTTLPAGTHRWPLHPHLRWLGSAPHDLPRPADDRPLHG